MYIDFIKNAFISLNFNNSGFIFRKKGLGKVQSRNLIISDKWYLILLTRNFSPYTFKAKISD